MTTLLAFATRALAQPLPIQFFDPSIEAAGMGGASIAAFWEENPNDHANPALMGFQSGLRYSYGSTQLVPEFDDEVAYKSHRILAGAWGVGVAMSGKPIESIGRIGIEYGPSTITDIDGNEIGVFDAHERIRSFAVGLSVFDLISSIRVAKGGEPLPLSRRLSLALGHAWKSYETDLAPVELLPNGHGEGNNNDAGILLRIAPFDQIGGTLRDANDRMRWKVDVAGAYTRTDYLNDHGIVYADGSSDDLFEHRSIGASTQLTAALANDGIGDLWDFATPSIRLSVAWEKIDVYEEGNKQGDLGNRVGGEISVLDMLFLRYGHVDGDAFDGEGNTYGGGFQLKYRNMVGVKGDFASYPRAGFFSGTEFERWGHTFFVDPYRLMKKGAN
jgi:hypothetical protein